MILFEPGIIFCKISGSGFEFNPRIPGFRWGLMVTPVAQASTGGELEVERCQGTASCPLPPEAFPEVIFVSDRQENDDHHICNFCYHCQCNVFTIIRFHQGLHNYLGYCTDSIAMIIFDITTIVIIVMMIIDIIIIVMSMLIRSTTPWLMVREV